MFSAIFAMQTDVGIYSNLFVAQSVQEGYAVLPQCEDGFLVL